MGLQLEGCGGEQRVGQQMWEGAEGRFGKNSCTGKGWLQSSGKSLKKRVVACLCYQEECKGTIRLEPEEEGEDWDPHFYS